MSELGEVFETIHAGRHSLRSLQAEVREWRNFPRGREAFARVMGRVAGSLPEDLAAKAPEETETRSRLWVVRPGRMRLERLLDGDEVAVVVVQGERWWSHHPAQGFSSSADEGHVPEPHTSAMRQLLDPWALLGHLRLEAAGDDEVAGRKGIRLRGRPEEVRRRTALAGLGQGADAYELTVDREFGVLLRTEAQLEGEAFEVKEMTVASFGLDIPDEVFPFPTS